MIVCSIWVQEGHTERCAVLDLSCPLSLEAEMTDILLQGLNGPFSHTTSHEPRNRVFLKTARLYMNSSITFAAAYTVSSKTMALATLDVTSQTETPSMVYDIPGRKNGILSYFQTNFDFVNSIIMVASVFGCILENALC